MTNLLGFCVVLTSLAVAGVVVSLSLNSEKLNNGDERVIRVEYDKDVHDNTRVSVSSDSDRHVLGKSSFVSGAVNGAKSSVFSESSEEDENESHGVVGKVFDKVKEKVEEGKDVVGEVFDKMTERVHDVGDGAMAAIERSAKEALDKAKRAGKTAIDMSVTCRDVVRNVTEDVICTGQHAVDTAKEANKSAGRMVERVKTAAANVKEESKNRLGEILYDVGRYVAAPETWGSFMNVVNLLGLSMSYGMCIWVPFVSSHVLLGALQRQQFVMVQSKIYPVYFRGMAYSIGMALLGHLLSQKNVPSKQACHVSGL